MILLSFLQQLVTSLIATGAFGILFNIERNRLIHGGIVGMIGWLLYYFLIEYRVNSLIAIVAASLVIGVISHIFAKKFKTPIIIFSVSGIIPLVPGGLAYDAMRHFVVNDYNTAIQLAAQAFLFSGAIGFGLILAEVFNQFLGKTHLANRVK
ncbi:threonine/serine exporter family protein [Terrilactibacillus laevilacticus]|uniref:Threonine/serine exporter family protein n=1 Tax=Terrilactibacillus laevilacticus TaxID=1380157 RepID=A0ABW5PUM8_9BACI|nr:threonine/serine exporter family protein [Terrilactibacillus laevilacticus]